MLHLLFLILFEWPGINCGKREEGRGSIIYYDDYDSNKTARRGPKLLAITLALD
jgi:hypothetical protein